MGIWKYGNYIIKPYFSFSNAWISFFIPPKQLKQSKGGCLETVLGIVEK